MELECIAFGVPPPEISWKFGECLENLLLFNGLILY